jgi:hypothetical protein
LQYKIAFTGGEVTANKDFLPFLEWLRDNYNKYLSQLLITTNGSATATVTVNGAVNGSIPATNPTSVSAGNYVVSSSVS